ncbi:MAG: hypothetical protein Q4F08_07290, partial [Rikenellaceae bacterium]|nr:hypothetical protein [Rikenellaceae bacterium]
AASAVSPSDPPVAAVRPETVAKFIQTVNTSNKIFFVISIFRNFSTEKTLSPVRFAGKSSE